MSKESVISIQNLKMRYGAYMALAGVSFSVNQGEILGLLGPNGAGKTTLMRILTTYLYPTEGTAAVCGYDVIQQPLEVRNRLGYLPETAPLYLGMQTEEYLTFIGRARGVTAQQLPQRLKWVKNACGLSPVWRHALGELSKGFRQRVGLAQALIHDPEVLILDEPTSGLDPLQIMDIRKLVRELARDKTIIFSTHILQEVEALADRIVIINNGRIVANGTREEIGKKAGHAERLHIAVKGDSGEIEQALRDLGACEDIVYEGGFGSNGHRYLLRAKAGHPLPSLVDGLIKSKNWPLLDFHEEDAGLEEAFLTLLQQKKND